MSADAASSAAMVSERESRLLAVLSSIDDSLITTDERGVVTFMNRAAEATTGFAFSEAEARPLEEVFRVSLFFEIASDARVTLFTRDGGTTLIEHSASPILDAQGSVRGTVITFRDVSEKVTLDAERALTARLTSVAAIAAGVSHELNNPVASVESNLQFAARALGELVKRVPRLAEPLTDTMDALADGAAGVERVKEIVKQMKIFLFADAGPSRFDVNHALRIATRLLATDIAAAGELTESLGVVAPVMCDEGQLVQCFMNVLKNATQALAGRQGTITVRSFSEAPYAIIEIEDDGAGISPNNLERVFEPFFTTRPPMHGVGLGLAISRAIVLRAGGLITAESVGRATTVRVKLPLALSAA